MGCFKQEYWSRLPLPPLGGPCPSWRPLHFLPKDEQEKSSTMFRSGSTAMAPGALTFPLLQAQDLDYRERPADPRDLPPSSWRKDLLILESALELPTALYCLHQAGGQWKVL